MSSRKIETANKSILEIIKASNNLLKIGDQFFKPFNITATQYNVLVILKENKKKISQQELGSQLVVTRSDITGIVDRLEKYGYVKRVPHNSDRRIKLLEITNKGNDLINLVEPQYFEKVNKIIKALSIEELENITFALKRFQLT
ncbi:MAG: MarR family transcriptional regulator [bacterium]